MNSNELSILKDFLEKTYLKFNKKEYIHPDPLEFLFNYKDQKDIEIVGLIASSLAYGRVNQILISVEKVLKLLGPSPYKFLKENRLKTKKKELSLFKHRFTTGEEVFHFLHGISLVLNEYESLESLFFHGFSESKNLNSGLNFFVKEILKRATLGKSTLLSDPLKGSACKRLQLFMRWMVRHDNVDPGPWSNISPSILLIPLDVHMQKISKLLKLTQRKDNTWKTAAQITNSFKLISPEDPVKYDFALTRFGINPSLSHLYSTLNGHLQT